MKFEPMSIASRKRNAKQPTPVSGRPRLFGAISKPAPYSFTDMQKQMHKAALNAWRPKPGGAFGGTAAHNRAA